MLYKVFYSILMGIFPWISAVSLPITLAQAPQVQIVDEKQTSADEYLQKEKIAKEAILELAKADEDVAKQLDLFCISLKDGISKKLLTTQDAEMILEGTAFAAEKHKAQVRSNPKKTPYIIHPIEVADFVIRIGKVYDRKIIIAALLHDLMDDTNTTYEEISSRFGNTVSEYVKEMTMKKNVSLKEQKKAQIIQAFRQTPNVAVIKLSDKLSNLGTLLHSPPTNWSKDRIDQYFQWAQSVIENLPDSNHLLKKAVKKVIADYWAKQNESEKS